MAKKYRKIEVELETLDPEFCHDTLFSLKNTLIDLEARYPDYTGLRIDVNQWYDDVTIKLMGTRSETDKERNKRLAKARKLREIKKQRQAQLETQEKVELKRLLAKHGK